MVKNNNNLKTTKMQNIKTLNKQRDNAKKQAEELETIYKTALQEFRDKPLKNFADTPERDNTYKRLKDAEQPYTDAKDKLKLINFKIKIWYINKQREVFNSIIDDVLKVFNSVDDIFTNSGHIRVSVENQLPNVEGVRYCLGVANMIKIIISIDRNQKSEDFTLYYNSSNTEGERYTTHKPEILDFKAELKKAKKRLSLFNKLEKELCNNPANDEFKMFVNGGHNPYPIRF